PDYMVMGMSAETFWDGVEGNRKFTKRISDWAHGLKVATGAEACERALKLFNVKKIGVVTPYQPVGDKNVVRFFSDLGFEVAAIKGFRCPTAISIAHVTQDELRNALMEVNKSDVDALVQVGTNLSMVSLADEAERWLGKPVIAINAATYWMALRDNGIQDKVYGCGKLLREF
ncbi:MAG TPA: arylmalonate decarboxylase, partial [Anaerolineae bacterium]|nr:arylmalonate decarboxylase [Anaerolineae bacterium]